MMEMNISSIITGVSIIRFAQIFFSFCLQRLIHMTIYDYLICRWNTLWDYYKILNLTVMTRIQVFLIYKLTWIIFYSTNVLINELLKCNVWSQTVYATSWTVEEYFYCLNLFSSLHSMIKYQKKPNGLLIFRIKVGRFLTFLIVAMGNKHNRYFSEEENSFVLYFEDLL